MAKDNRVQYSIYLTPRASKILNQYVAASGYGSISRTTEEIILAFHAIYEGTHAMQFEGIVKALDNPGISFLLTAFLNATTRLKWPKGMPLNE